MCKKQSFLGSWPTELTLTFGKCPESLTQQQYEMATIILSFLPETQPFAVQAENAKSRPRFTRKFLLTIKIPSCQDTSALSCQITPCIASCAIHGKMQALDIKYPQIQQAGQVAHVNQQKLLRFRSHLQPGWSPLLQCQFQTTNFTCMRIPSARPSHQVWPKQLLCSNGGLGWIFMQKSTTRIDSFLCYRSLNRCFPHPNYFTWYSGGNDSFQSLLQKLYPSLQMHYIFTVPQEKKK